MDLVKPVGAKNRLMSLRKVTAVKNAAVTFFLILLFLPGVGFSMGLEVDPDEIVVSACPLGKKVAVSDLGGEKMKLKIKNKSDVPYTYIINVLYTSATVAPYRQGYKDIPDTAWIQPENNEVQVSANSTKAVELYLNIPKKPEYYNKNYQAVINVKNKKNSPEEIFVLACQLKICFSTAKAEEQKNEK